MKKVIINLLFWTALAVFCVTIGFVIVKAIKLEQSCTGHLKRAADANTIELALEELNVAIDYLEEKGDTAGYTSIIYETPDEDIAFFYKNLKACQSELSGLPETASQMDKTNTLMKLRETLCDSSENGTILTFPDGLSKYPNNAVYFWLISISLLICCALFVPLIEVLF